VSTNNRRDFGRTTLAFPQPEEARSAASLAAPESLKTKMLKNTVPRAVGCIINGPKQVIPEFQVYL
jgi:hypothetical protein